MSITKTIELILVVSWETFFNMLRVRTPLCHASVDAPIAPTAADSVGVAIPASIEPRTIIIKKD